MTEDTSSDDALMSQNVRIADGQTSITIVYQQDHQASGINPVAVGHTIVVEGRTNLQPSDNTITVELCGEDASVGLPFTEEWGQNGQWSVTLDTIDASTGTYTVEADDGDRRGRTGRIDQHADGDADRNADAHRGWRPQVRRHRHLGRAAGYPPRIN
jgi:hypothetical protein